MLQLDSVLGAYLGVDLDEPGWECVSGVLESANLSSQPSEPADTALWKCLANFPQIGHVILGGARVARDEMTAHVAAWGSQGDGFAPPPSSPMPGQHPVCALV